MGAASARGGGGGHGEGLRLPEPTLLVYEVDGLPLYLAPGGERRALDAALGLGLEPFAEIFEL